MIDQIITSLKEKQKEAESLKGHHDTLTDILDNEIEYIDLYFKNFKIAASRLPLSMQTDIRDYIVKIAKSYRDGVERDLTALSNSKVIDK